MNTVSTLALLLDVAILTFLAMTNKAAMCCTSTVVHESVYMMLYTGC